MLDYTTSKLILLFFFDKMEIPLQEDIVIEICSGKNDWVPYIDARPAFLQLLEVGFITEVSRGGANPLYKITNEGRMCLKHFYTKIPMSVREEIVMDTKQNRINYKKRQEYFSDYFKNPDGTYSVVLKIVGTRQPLLELKLNNLTRNNAKWIHKCWKEKAPDVYEVLHEILIE